MYTSVDKDLSLLLFAGMKKGKKEQSNLKKNYHHIGVCSSYKTCMVLTKYFNSKRVIEFCYVILRVTIKLFSRSCVNHLLGLLFNVNDVLLYIHVYFTTGSI